MANGKRTDPRLKPLPGAEPYKYHDRILYSPLESPKTLRHAKRAGLRMQRTRGRMARRKQARRA